MSDDLSDLLAETLEGILGSLAGAHDDVVKRQQLAEAAGVETLALPDWLDGAVQALRPNESRAEQLARLLGLVDNFVDFLRASNLEFTDPDAREDELRMVTEVLMRLVVPTAMEIWRGKHPFLYLGAAIALFLDDRASEFRAGELSYDRLVRTFLDILHTAATTEDGERRGAVIVVNAFAAAAVGAMIAAKVIKPAGWTFDFAYGFEAPTALPGATGDPVPPDDPIVPTDPSHHVHGAAQRTFSIWWRRVAQPLELARYDDAPYDPHPPESTEISLTLAPLVISDEEQHVWIQTNLARPIDVPLSSRWRFRVPLEGAIGMAIPLGTMKPQGGGSGRARVELVWDGGEDPRPFSGPGGVQTSLGSFTLAAFAELGHAGSAEEELTTGDIGWSMRLARLRVAAPKPEGGVMGALFANGASYDLDLGLRWSHRDGLVLDGGTGLEFFLPIRRRWAPTAAGTTWVEAEITYVRLRAEITSGEQRGLTLSATGGFALGLLGVTLVIDGFGGAFDAKTTDGTGNLFRLGNAETRLVMPSGIGARIDLGPIEGGGYFAHDAATGRYMGAIDVKLGKRWSLRGFGFVEDRPGGGTSFVAVVNLELDTWSPGFQIDGFGVIVATHRRGDGDALRAALDTGDLDALLFPEDPLRRVPELVASLNRFFPLADGVHVFGIAVRMSYGLGLVRVRAAGLVQVSNRTVDKLFIVLIAKLVLPEPFENVLAIELAGVGEYTFGGGPLEVRARLRNSHVAGGELTGGAIVFWGDLGEGAGSGVWASIGGYHPRYEHVPARVAVPERVMLAWHKGDDLQASLKMYVALTPGAFHIGAEVSLRATLEGFGIKASLGFDGLVTDDWHFRLELYGEVSILLFSRTLCGLSFRGGFYGHSPTWIDGSAKISLLFWSKTFPYSKRLTDEESDTGNRTDVGERLRAAFATGWSSGSDDDVVAVKQPRAGIVVMPHRMLRWEQAVLPLVVPITRVGPIALGGAHAFVVDELSFGAGTTAAFVRARFPRGQFFDLSDDDRLRGPAFSDEVAGAELRADAASGDELPAAGDYQEVVVDRGRTRRPPPRRWQIVGELVEAGLSLRADAGTWHRPPATPVTIAAVDYRVVGPDLTGPIVTFQQARKMRTARRKVTRVIR